MDESLDSLNVTMSSMDQANVVPGNSDSTPPPARTEGSPVPMEVSLPPLIPGPSAAAETSQKDDASSNYSSWVNINSPRSYTSKAIHVSKLSSNSSPPGVKKDSSSTKSYSPSTGSRSQKRKEMDQQIKAKQVEVEDLRRQRAVHQDQIRTVMVRLKEGLLEHAASRDENAELRVRIDMLENEKSLLNSELGASSTEKLEFLKMLEQADVRYESAVTQRQDLIEAHMQRDRQAAMEEARIQSYAVYQQERDLILQQAEMRMQNCE